MESARVEIEFLLQLRHAGDVALAHRAGDVGHEENEAFAAFQAVRQTLAVG